MMAAARSEDVRQSGYLLGGAIRRHWVLCLVSIMYALGHRSALSGRWGWMLASGIIDIGLGVLLLIGLPGTALWALGLLLGINLIFGGWALIFMALHARPTSAAAAA
jgi:uncharacterized membrane protein HdeD (DUF308 family)